MIMLLPALREEVCRLHAELPKNNLVAWTSGNLSARDPESNLVVIKPSGITFPTEGCWQVTGRVGEASLTFVALVLAG